jgi:hypothetical protein
MRARRPPSETLVQHSMWVRDIGWAPSARCPPAEQISFAARASERLQQRQFGRPCPHLWCSDIVLRGFDLQPEFRAPCRGTPLAICWLMYTFWAGGSDQTSAHTRSGIQSICANQLISYFKILALYKRCIEQDPACTL